MDERRCLEVLRAHNEWRRYDGLTGQPGAPAMVNPTELGQALDHAIATIERVAGAPNVAVSLGKAELALTAFQLGEDEPDSLIESAKGYIAEARGRLPDPQPDGQEG